MHNDSVCKVKTSIKTRLNRSLIAGASAERLITDGFTTHYPLLSAAPPAPAAPPRDEDVLVAAPGHTVRALSPLRRWLGRGSMFVLSGAQAQRLLCVEGAPENQHGALLDLGAGDGAVSGRFAHLFERKYATEISASMRNVLSSKGYTILDADEWWRSSEDFSCVSMLNLLDRCIRPKSMLRQARAAMLTRPHAKMRLLIALVLPYKPYVEATPDHKPEERLPIEGTTVEEQACSFVQWMEASGWSLQAWTRVPYLCEGDFAQSYYWLDDTVFVFTPVPLENEKDV
ncbi:Methyltransferase-like protein 9 [Eumeta japonica]|uniref:Methyltransferase-like protein 9 n=1 Tax=Eumeta variegata TaxID=151549 RepID=A0A4C1WRD3_EUMVA|nr:Methyltransferase-like protein 9 [Eumeta japonica]